VRHGKGHEIRNDLWSVVRSHAQDEPGFGQTAGADCEQSPN
jgi:hypothetical protein